MRALLRKIRQILRDRKTRRIFTRLVSTVAAIVVFVTTYALVLPAITMESEAACGIEAHQHDQSCYTDVLVCEIPESPGHVHDESCYSTKQKQVCQIEEHVHGSDCYDGNGKLICEKDEHQHGEDCFEEVRELVCEIPESPGHQHDDSCYQKVLTCGKEVHTHSAACYHVETASQPATEAIAVASTESAAAATGNGLVDNLNDPAENGEPETSLDSSIENNVIEGNLDASPDYSEPGSDLTSLTNEGDKDEPRAWTSTEAIADATGTTAATTASTGPGAGVTGSTGSSTGGTAATVASAGATDTMSSAAGYVPVLDELNFDTLLNKHTGIYYSKPAGTDSAVDNETNRADAAADTGGTQEEAAAANTGETKEEAVAANTGETQAKESDPETNSGEKQEESIAENTGEAQEEATWNRIDKHTELKESDNLRLYLAYTIPAGSLNETNQTARYSLPKNIHLMDEQVNEINTTVNGIAGQYVSYDTLEILDQEMYGKYLGIEAVEGTRTPADDLDEYLANNEGQEFISATVKVENVFDENTGVLKAQDLVFTFAPYTIQKNRHQYDPEGKPTKAGEEINGWLAIDISTEQIDWEKADGGIQTADIVFVEKDKKSDLKEISTELRLVGAEFDSDTDTNVGNAAHGVSSDAAATDNKQDGTKDSETAAGESGKAEKEPVSFPSVSFDDSITIAGGALSTDTDEASGDAGMAAETEITVHVEADKDTFPEGTTMVLSAVSDDQMTAVAEAVEGAVDAPKTMGFHAVDISFRDVKGNEIEPLKPIRVSMTSDAIRRAVQDESTAPVVVHVSNPSVEQDATDENTDDGGSTDTTDVDDTGGADSQHILDSSESPEDQVSGSNLETTPSANIIETDTGTKENNGDTLIFDAEDFSVYAIVYTVEFHYEINGKMYEFSIPGGGFVSLEHLVEVLGIAFADENTENVAENAENGTNNADDFVGEVPSAEENGENSTAYEEAIKLNEVKVSEATKKFVADVESVEFSNPKLVWVNKIDEETTVGGIKEGRELDIEYSTELTEEQITEINAQKMEAGDWALISMQPFTSEESLTVTMKNGDVWTVKVTDAQISTHVITADGQDYIITVTYGPEAGIPDGATLEADEISADTLAYKQHLEQAKQALCPEEVPGSKDGSKDDTKDFISWEVAFARFFDISIIVDDDEIEPLGPVDVSITYIGAGELEKVGRMNVVHFAENNIEILEVDSSALDSNYEATFVQDSFSVTGTLIGYSSIKDNDEFYILHYVEASQKWYALASDGSTVDVTAYYDSASRSIVGYNEDSNIRWEFIKTSQHTTNTPFGTVVDWVTHQIKAKGENKYVSLYPNGTIVGTSPENINISRSQWWEDGYMYFYNYDHTAKDGPFPWSPDRTLDYKLGWGDDQFVFKRESWTSQQSPTAIQLARVTEDSQSLSGSYANLTYNETQLEAWLEQALTTDPLQQVSKKASVYDYDNRIYQIDFHAQSGVLAMASDISLAFVTDVSNSMLFPASLTETGKTMTTQEISDSSSSTLNRQTVYYVIGDVNGTSTVYALFYTSNGYYKGQNMGSGAGWYALDASYFAKCASGKLSWTDSSMYSSGSWRVKKLPAGLDYNRLSSQDTPYQSYTIYTANDEYLAAINAGNIFDMTTDPVNNRTYGLNPDGTMKYYVEADGSKTYFYNTGNRLFYLESSITSAVKDMQTIAREYPLGEVYTALETFAGDKGVGAVKSRLDYKKIGGIQNDMESANITYNANYLSLFNAIKGITTEDGTRQDLALSDSIFFGSNPGTGGYIGNNDTDKKYVILITDGAPNPANKKDDVIAAARKLKQNGINVITVGLSIESVTNADEMLWNSASGVVHTYPDIEYPNEARLFYWAKSGQDLTWIIREIIRSVMKEATVSATIKDEICSVFYPVDANGEPLSSGDWIKLDGTKWENGDPESAKAGQVTAKNTGDNDSTNDTWEVEWADQAASWTGWNGTIYVKAKEDFLGGNNITTNVVSSVTPTSYSTYNTETNETKSANYSIEQQEEKKINPATPCVNVDELRMIDNTTSFVVHVGTEVDPEEELTKLWNEIKVIEVVKKNGDTGGYKIAAANSMMYDPARDNKTTRDQLPLTTNNNYVPIDLEHYIPDSVFNNLLDSLKDGNLSSSYTSDPISYSPYDQGITGTLTVTLTKNVINAVKDTAPGVHAAEDYYFTSTNEETYALIVTYTPSDEETRKDLLVGTGIVSATDENYKHNGEAGPGNVTDVSNSTSNHRIQVFSKGFRITKKDESFSNTLTGARFKLYRTARDTDPEDQKESLSGLEGEFIEVEDLDTSAEGVAQCDEVRTLLEDEQYYLVETEAPDGYIINHPVLVNLLTENTYRPIPGSNPWQGEKPDTGLYDWHQESALTLGPTGSVKIWTGEELIESATGLLPDGDTYIIEYYISNNPGVELPATGGSGTRLYYLIGLLMMVIAGTGLVIRRNALHGAKSHG